MCITRPHCANIAMIVAGTSSKTRKHHVNRTHVQMSSINPGGVVCFHHGTVPCQNVADFKTQTMTGSVTKTHVDGFHHANHHLSKKASLILVVWCSSQKTYSTNVARIITGTAICAPTRLDNIPWNATVRSVCVYPWTTQCNICKDNR